VVSIEEIEKQIHDQNVRWTQLIAEARACEGGFIDPRWLEELEEAFKPALPAQPVFHGMRG
jgi:hypothetical protein